MHAHIGITIAYVSGAISACMSGADSTCDAYNDTHVSGAANTHDACMSGVANAHDACSNAHMSGAANALDAHGDARMCIWTCTLRSATHVPQGLIGWGAL